MQVQAITSFSGFKLFQKKQENKADIHRYRDPNTDSYFYYDTKSNKEVPCDTFTLRNKKSKNSKLQDDILEYWDAVKW